LEREGVSYAVDTLRQLHALYPDTRFSLIMGMDSLRDLHLWHKADELVTLCDVIAVERPGTPPEIPHHLPYRTVRGRLCEISSSEIRQRVANGESIRYLVPPAVEDYIRTNGLYKR
jgi:nicotinate-nucleotide adenylyltransferase